MNRGGRGGQGNWQFRGRGGRPGGGPPRGGRGARGNWGGNAFGARGRGGMGNFRGRGDFNNFGPQRGHNEHWRGRGFRGGFGGPFPPFGPRFNKDLNPKFPKRFDPSKRLCEKDVGITEYISTHEGFNGIIKQRFSDFHVNEIDEEGKVIHLTSMEVPKLVTKAVCNTPLEEVLPKEKVDALRTIMTDFGAKNKVEIDVTAMLKDERKLIHEVIRGEFGDKLNSNTKTIGETKILVICRANNRFMRQDTRQPWPEDRPGKYTHFVLYKENLDTMEAVSFITGRFNMNPSNASYAGTKDKRGMTSQRMAMFKVEPQKLVDKCRNQTRIKFGNFEFKTEPLQLGGLKGNRFGIALRNVTGTPEQIELATTSLQENGFINYYGLQRFGNSAKVPTYEIGKELLLGHWKKAVQLILKPRHRDQNMELNAARQIWTETGSASKAYNALHYLDHSIEGKLLTGLIKCGDSNFLDALERVPRNTRLLYLHAYQSLVWNKIVSRRIKEFGLKPIVGDLVLVDDIQSEIFFDDGVQPDEEASEQEKPNEDAAKDTADLKDESIKTESQIKVEIDSSELKEESAAKEAEDPIETVKTENGAEKATDEAMDVGEESGENGDKEEDGDAAKAEEEKTEAETDSKTEEAKKEELRLAGEDIVVETTTKRPDVKVLTEEDLENYAITDIVLPLPGFNVELPQNEVKDWYDEYLKEDGLSISGMKQNISRKYSLGGAYRKLVVKPEEFSSRVVRYTGADKVLILSDFERLREEPEPTDEPEGEYQALLLFFNLPSSCYATMALRDILKRDTSTSFQATLNMYHKDNQGEKRKEGDAADENSPRKKAKVDEEEEKDILDDESRPVTLEDL